ncbi:hypothetical protein Ntsu_72050 [Nocardia sp. IFM 10818]
MSSTQPDHGHPAPNPAAISPAEAVRLLESIRQAEEELAETGELIAVSDTAETGSAADESATKVESATVAPSESGSAAADSVDDRQPETAEAAAAAQGAVAVAERLVVDEAESAADEAEQRAVVATELPVADAEQPAADAAEQPAAVEAGQSAAVDVEQSAAVDVEQSAAVEAEAPVAVEAVESVVVDAEEPVADAWRTVAVEIERSAAEDAGSAQDESAEADSAAAVDGSAAASAEDAGDAALATSGVLLPGTVADDVETIVHVMRHGEVHNPKGILYGRLPGFQLSVTGRAQAQAVSRSLADHDIALVVASPLQRAQETAEPIALQHGVLIRTDDNLIEAGNTFEGLRVSVGDGALRKPRHWWKLRDPFTPSWGEPYLQIAHRMLAAVNKARVEAAGREAVLVSHQLPVWTLRRFLQGQRLWHDPRARQCSLASLTSLVYQGDTLIDIVYSEPAGASDPTVHGA